jgi:DNA-binding IclR family transcriptional regulator
MLGSWIYIMSKAKSELGDGAGAQELKSRGLAGTQTLVRGLEVIDAVAQEELSLPELAVRIGLTRSTTHRLAACLVNHRYLRYQRSAGYSLGPRLLELGHVAGRQSSLLRVARQHLEQLGGKTQDTVHLGVLEGPRARYLDKIPGMRRVEVSSRIGELHPLRSTGLGKALILDATESEWREYYDYEARLGHGYTVDLQVWLRRMRQYAKIGYAFDLEENEDRIRCVAAPVRDVTGAIAGAISVSSAAQYMDDSRMYGLGVEVKNTADAISRELGYDPDVVRRASAPRGKARGKLAAAGGRRGA